MPCIHPADGALHLLGLLHRGARSAVEFAGDARFASADGPALLRPVVQVGGQEIALDEGTMIWERAHAWIPSFTCTVRDLVIRGTIFAPYGRDLDIAGACYLISVENRSETAVDVRVRFDGVLGHRQIRVRSAREVGDTSRVTDVGEAGVLLEGTAQPGLAAIALQCEAPGGVHRRIDGTKFSLGGALDVDAGASAHLALYIGAGPERDGAQATAGVMARRGWRAMLAGTRDALQALEQSTGVEAVDRLINRNLVFAFFYGVGRAIDDAHYYLVRTRVPWHAAGVTIRDWDALMGILPAVQLADTGLARELLLRMCELHAYAPGQGVHYLDGTMFEPGFALEGVVAYPIAIDRYIRDTNDGSIVEDPVVAEALYSAHDDLLDRRDARIALYSTDVTPDGLPAPFGFTTHANAAAAQALDVLRRTLDEQTAREVEDPAVVRAAINRHLRMSADVKATYAAAADLKGQRTSEDLPAASLAWLPLFEMLDRSDSTYRRTVKGIGSTRSLLVQEIGALLGPDADAALQWLRRAPLFGGLAAEQIDADGLAVGNAGDAALSGLLACTAWQSVHVLGVTG